MTEKEQEMLVVLKRVSKLETQEEWDEYERVCSALPITNDPNVLQEMMLCLRDTYGGDVMWSLIEACERFPAEIYTRSFINMSEEICKNAPECFSLMLCTVFNTECNFEVLRESVRKLSVEKRQFLYLYTKDLLVNHLKYRRVFEMLFLGKDHQ